MAAFHSTRWAVVIPAYNERGKLKNVLRVACQASQVREIIVVDDGSTDGTELDVQEISHQDARIRYIRLTTNQGKTRAIWAGVNAAQSEYILLLDADLLNLKVEHLEAMIHPVQDGRAEMTVGVFRKGKWITDASQFINPWLSGQRGLVKDLFYQVPLDQVVGYGIETAFTVIARRLGWRVEYVPLWGAYHQPTEIRRGAFVGLFWKGRMYAHILRTYIALKGKKRAVPRYRVFWGLFVLVLVVALLSLGYNISRADSTVHPEDLPLLDLGQSQRLLVIAAHPDDETLGAGGAIQAALARGMQVRVVVFTNGDGQPVAPLILQKDILPKAQDFVRNGEIRQQESIHALRLLGVPAEKAYYLGYPDRQLDRLWLDNWQSQCPLRGDFTRAIQVPYPNVYSPGAAYCGSTLLDLVKRLLNDYRPDVILLHHLSDDHPDHRAASQFTLLGVAEITAQDPSYSPLLWGYVIHFGKYPRLRGWHLKNSLLPPIPLVSSGDAWARLDLTSDQELLKAQAIRAYSSQFKMMKSFLESFARQDEIYHPIEMLEFSDSWFGAIEINRSNDLELAQTTEPAKESTRRMLLTGTDLVKLQVDDLDGQIQVAAATRGELLPDLHYRIHFKLTDGTTKTCDLALDGLRLGPSTYACALDVSPLQVPTVIGFQAEVDKGVTLDRSGWHFLLLR
jgi:LmbE family N-acetylglucosaminyl deacetylase/glycosyltransferase involved in cell wall biosynthesis